jgi:hypothetical protein
MREPKRKKIATISIFSFFLCLLLLAPITTAVGAEPTLNIKPALLKIISSVPGPNLHSLPIEESQSEPLPEKDADSAAAPSDLSGVRLFFPLNHNDVKDYEGSVSGTTYSATYRYAQVLYNGRTCFRETDSLDGSIVYYGYSGSDLNMYGLSLDGDDWPFDTPLRILNDSILNDGGTLRSRTTFTVEGTRVTLDISVTASLAGSVTIPLGRADNCRSVEMSFLFSIAGTSETIELEDVWILAPDIGKLKIALIDEELVQRGWLILTGGTVGGEDVAEILKPTISGYVRTSDGNGISGVTILFSAGAGSALTNSSGYYSHRVNFRWSGTATPALRGYTFTPALRSYTNVTSNWSNQNFIGAIKKAASFPFLNLLLTGEE